MSDTDTGENAAGVARPDMTAREWEAVREMARQQIALEDYTPDTPPRITLRVISGDPPTVEIPCELHGPCQWTHDGRGGVACGTDGCSAWARPGMELHDKVISHIGPKA